MMTKRASARAEIYYTLSNLLMPPLHDFLESLLCGAVKEDIDSHLNELKYELSFPDVHPSLTFEKIKERYNKLFVGPIPPFATLCESVYKPWDSTGKSSLGRTSGNFMGDCAVDMERRFESVGAIVPKQYSHMPDHLALILEYFSEIASVASVKEQLEFLGSHLDWLPALRKEMNATDNSELYVLILLFIESLVTIDMVALKEAN